MARELRGPMRGLLVLEAVKYRRSDSYLTGLGGYFANVARSGLPMNGNSISSKDQPYMAHSRVYAANYVKKYAIKIRSIPPKLGGLFLPHTTNYERKLLHFDNHCVCLLVYISP